MKIENLEIRKCVASLKELEKDFGSISPKMVETRNKIKGQIREMQLKINKLRLQTKLEN